MTKAMSKQLLPVYDKPMIYYPLSVLLLSGIRDILLISAPDDLPAYKRLLGDGQGIGVHLQYAVQQQPRGLAEALLIGEVFTAGDSVCLILGDNIFYGQDLTRVLGQAVQENPGATIFGYPVKDPRAFGVVEFDEDGGVLSIEEKPEQPRSSYAVPGLYIYDGRAADIVRSLAPSLRGELEITALNDAYLRMGALRAVPLGRGMTWLDAGTPDGLLKASLFVQTIQDRQGFYVSCIEEIAWRRGFITTEQLYALGEVMQATDYGQYLLSLAKGAMR